MAVQAVYIAMVTPGGSMPADLNFVAFPAIALGILSGKEPSVAVAIAATIGIAGTILFNFMMVLNSYWNHRADVALEQGTSRGLPPQRHLPAGQQLRAALRAHLHRRLFWQPVHRRLHEQPAGLVIRTMTVVGGILPAVGIAILLKQIIKQSSMLIYFLVGFRHRLSQAQHGGAGDDRRPACAHPLQLQAGAAPCAGCPRCYPNRR